jgi:hypothetical protein
MTATGAVRRETPVTEGYDVLPEEDLRIPRESWAPIACAAGIAVLFVGLLVSAQLVAVAGVAGLVVAAGVWAWRTEEDLR